MEQKQVKIIGLSINENFGSLKATNLKFDPDCRLTVIKGEVGSGKTTLNRAMRLSTQGTQTMQDKTLLGDNVNIVAQLMDGETSVFVGCKSKEDGSLEYFIYTLDSNGKKVKDVVIDGTKLTPAGYLKSLQTALTWNLNELTSENPTVQRDILLSLYVSELEEKGVYFDKKHSKYSEGIISKIEQAKEQRNYKDMKRKEVGGIASDLSSKGIDHKERKIILDVKSIETEISELKAEKFQIVNNASSHRANKLNELKLAGLTIAGKLRDKNDLIKKENSVIKDLLKGYERDLQQRQKYLDSAKETLQSIVWKDDFFVQNLFEKHIVPNVAEIKKPTKDEIQEIEFNEKGTCVSKTEDFKDPEIIKLIEEYQSAALAYVTEFSKQPEEIDTTETDKKILEKESKLKSTQQENQERIAINALHDWKEEDEKVKAFNKDYFMKLTEINTGVEGLFICPEYETDSKGEKTAKGNDIYLMYDGSYDTDYFHNKDKDLRKLAAYSDTQKPMICLLIQRYLLSKKSKVLPYLWIDQVPIDKKTKALLDRMSEELGLWLFVNWTGDFDKENLKDGEILIENGKVFHVEPKN